MDVENAFEYDFTISSSSALEVTLYDSDFSEINVLPTATNGGLTKTFSYYLSVVTYYLQSNYVSSTVSGTISVSIDGEPHTHSYGDTYLWKDGTTHFSKCECGLFITEAHVVLSTTSNKCLLCNGSVDHGLVEININSSQVRMITVNGSYILPNGVIVLVYEDLKTYLNGTLIFYDKNIVTQ